MKIAKVVGTLVSPVSHPLFEGQRLLVCDLVDPDGSVDGSLMPVDVVNAGVGERVLICDEGTSARQMLGITTGPVRSVIVGIVDHIT